MHLTSYLAQIRPTFTIRRRRRMNVAVVQTGSIFQLPYELFQEILSYIFPWPTAYYRIAYHMAWPRPGPEVFLGRARALLALSATCRTMRQMVLMEAWKDYLMRRMTPTNQRRIWTKLLSECGILLGDPHLAAYVRTLVVDLTQGTSGAIKLFVKCLTVLPNLHTLEIALMWDGELAKVLVTALGKEKPQLQRLRILTLPPEVHQLLWYCPNVENLRCSSAPDECFAETLMASELNHLTKLSVVYLARKVDVWQRVARAYPGINELTGMLCEGWEIISLPRLTQFISAFKNLSTIKLIHRLSKAPGHPDRRSEPSEVEWNTLKGVAISQLEASCADGPKKLRTVVLWVVDDVEPKTVVEEIAVL